MIWHAFVEAVFVLWYTILVWKNRTIWSWCFGPSVVYRSCSSFFFLGPDSSLYIQSIEEQPGPSYQAALICYLVCKPLLCGWTLHIHSSLHGWKKASQSSHHSQLCLVTGSSCLCGLIIFGNLAALIYYLVHNLLLCGWTFHICFLHGWIGASQSSEQSTMSSNWLVLLGYDK